jgi:hypothetical protein
VEIVPVADDVDRHRAVLASAAPRAHRFYFREGLSIFAFGFAQIMFCGRLFFSLGRDGIFHPLAGRGSAEPSTVPAQAAMIS